MDPTISQNYTDITPPFSITMATDTSLATEATPSNMSQSEIDSYLESLDVENAKLMVPTLVFIGVLILTGIFGNILVLLVYIHRFKPSTARVFIISLAVFDLMNNTMAQPGEIFDIYYAYRFTNNHLCKLKRFFNYFTTFCSVLSLVVVAVDRHRKICKALSKQITERLAIILVGVVVSCSLGITLPSLLLNGVKKIPTTIPGVLGTECKYADNFQNAAFPKIFLGFQFLLFLSSLTAMTVLYILVGRTVFKHSKFTFKGKRNSSHGQPGGVKIVYAGNVSSPNPSSSGTASTSAASDPASVTSNNNKDATSPSQSTGVNATSPSTISNTDNKDATLPSQSAGNNATSPSQTISSTYNKDATSTANITFADVEKKAASVKTPALDSKLKEMSKPSPGFDKIVASAQNAEKKIKVKKMKTRTTLMLCVITIVFVVSYLPYLSISIVKLFNKNFVKSMSTTAFMVYNVFLRSHYINAAVNPLVYSFCNAKFRDEAKQLLCFWKKRYFVK